MNHKPTNEAQTYFTFQLNQHELVNELVSISNKLSGIEFYDKDTITEFMYNKVQSFVCIQINNKNNLKRLKNIHQFLNYINYLFLKILIELI